MAWPWLAQADEQNQDNLFKLCPPPDTYELKYTAPPIFSADLIEATDISANQVQNTGKSTSIFSGDVLIERHQLRLRADEVWHNSDSRLLKISGNIHADTPSMSISASSGWMNMQTGEAEFRQSRYYIPEAHLSGETPLFSVSENRKTILKDTRFTTCPLNNPDWQLSTSQLELDQASATGTAKHTVFRLKGVPLLYFPWIQFPLGEERRSGLLVPNLGISSSRGFEFSVPWYWNIAPNQDAIITPRYMQKRGNMLETNYRYLTQSSSGNLDIEYLNNDKQLQQQRYLLHFRNRTKFTDSINLNLLANDVSDTNYLKDMGNNISVTNATHLERSASLAYKSASWNALLKAQTFQTIDTSISPGSRPYRRLPQISLKGKEDLVELENGYLTASLNTEWVDFVHEDQTRAQGSRFFLYPKLSLPMQGHAWFVTPSAGYMFSQYDTTDNNGSPANLEDRGLSIFSLDSGLFFEKNYNNSTLVQTLEPRIYYLNIPYLDQSAFPVFDTSEQNFSFASLFRENRFTGIDRIGDANQLTMALSSRLLNSSDGHELMSLNIGRIYYFDQQQVALNQPLKNTDASDIIAELSGNLKAWRARATVQWNTETSRSDKRSAQLNYAASDKAVFNIGYRFYRDPINEANNLEQTDLSFAWPFAARYALLSRWNYSLTDERNIQTLFGLEYESCCWALRLITQRYITEDTNLNETYNTDIMFQFILKGFSSSTNKKATSTLKHAILGYQPDY